MHIEQHVQHIGSSPRVRGKRERSMACRLMVGLIPARAGKTFCFIGHRERGWAHPRACGENVGAPPGRPGSKGSSPRVRGKLIIGAVTSLGPGLIPARAGKTLPATSRVSQSRAHPRACGENRAWPQSFFTLHGSSPRVRGKLFPPRLGFLRLRLIPARAGKTRVRSPLSSTPGAHPRACGENFHALPKRSLIAGSSPRVRGKQSRTA